MEINITDAEYQVMNLIWLKGESTSRELSEILEETMDWKPATVKTLLGRLVTKNVLETQKSGNRFIYRATIPKFDAVTKSIDSLINTMCYEEVGTAVKHLIDNYDLSSDDIQQIQALLAKKEPNNDMQNSCMPKN